MARIQVILEGVTEVYMFIKYIGGEFQRDLNYSLRS